MLCVCADTPLAPLAPGAAQLVTAIGHEAKNVTLTISLLGITGAPSRPVFTTELLQPTVTCVSVAYESSLQGGACFPSSASASQQKFTLTGATLGYLNPALSIECGFGQDAPSSTATYNATLGSWLCDAPPIDVVGALQAGVDPQAFSHFTLSTSDGTVIVDQARVGRFSVI